MRKLKFPDFNFISVMKWTFVTFFVCGICAAIYCYIGYTKLAEKHATIYANYTGINLIGEEKVLQDPYKLADRMFEEAKKMWEGMIFNDIFVTFLVHFICII